MRKAPNVFLHLAVFESLWFAVRTTGIYCSAPGAFRCDGHKCLSVNEKCNGVKSCQDGRDEEGCSESCPPKRPYRCDKTKCISSLHKCNAVINCKDGTDEMHCVKKTTEGFTAEIIALIIAGTFGGGVLILAFIAALCVKAKKGAKARQHRSREERRRQREHSRRQGQRPGRSSDGPGSHSTDVVQNRAASRAEEHGSAQLSQFRDGNRSGTETDGSSHDERSGRRTQRSSRDSRRTRRSERRSQAHRTRTSRRPSASGQSHRSHKPTVSDSRDTQRSWGPGTSVMDRELQPLNRPTPLGPDQYMCHPGPHYADATAPAFYPYYPYSAAQPPFDMYAPSPPRSPFNAFAPGPAHFNAYAPSMPPSYEEALNDAVCSTSFSGETGNTESPVRSNPRY